MNGLLFILNPSYKMKKRIAAIDMGTNTILMLITEIDGEGKLRHIRDEFRIARLGENLISTSKIQDSAVQRASEILSEYAQICKSENVDKIQLVATSALREAQNQIDVLNKLKTDINANFKIASTQDEALLSFLGTTEDSADSTVIDIGGGSTEFIRGKYPDIFNRTSYPIGAVKITEQFIQSHPPNLETVNQIRQYVRKIISKNLTQFKADKIYAVAGTPVTIAAVALGLTNFKTSELNGYKLHLNQIETVLDIFLSHSVEFLIKEFHIHPQRADLVTAGTIILLESLLALNSKFVLVSTKGLRYGILNSIKTNNWLL